MRIEFDPAAMARLDPADDHSSPAAGQLCNVVMTKRNGNIAAAFVGCEWDECCNDWKCIFDPWKGDDQYRWLCDSISCIALAELDGVIFYWEPIA